MYFSLVADFPLLPTQYGGLDGVLFDDGHMDMPLDVTVNFIDLEALLPKIPCWHGIINAFEIVFF